MNQTVQTISQDFTAGQTIQNVFSGLRLAELPASFGARFRVTLCAVSNVADMEIQLFAGNRAQPIHDSAVSVAATTGRIVTRDDVVCTFLADAGEKLQLTATSAAIATGLFRLIVQPF